MTNLDRETSPKDNRIFMVGNEGKITSEKVIIHPISTIEEARVLQENTRHKVLLMSKELLVAIQETEESRPAIEDLGGVNNNGNKKQPTGTLIENGASTTKALAIHKVNYPGAIMTLQKNSGNNCFALSTDLARALKESDCENGIVLEASECSVSTREELDGIFGVTHSKEPLPFSGLPIGGPVYGGGY
ncbi:hypothetical protein JW758_01050 [Candidatus Peregrinibacteria bacterium]|nr:hypothetical protein [Candidatus Peregrinibacteria bacterium]